MAFQKWAEIEKTPSKSDKKKVVLITFLVYSGVVHHEFVSQHQTVTAVLTGLRAAIRRKRSDFWAENLGGFHHVIAQSHSSMIVIDFLAKHFTQ